MTATVDHIRKARRMLASGRYLLSGGFTEQAGRDAYLAAYHAAQACIHAKTGKVPKTHRGTRAEFARLALGDSRIEQVFVSFLARAYDLKTIADYEETAPITPAEAEATLDLAAKLVEAIAAIL